MGDNLNTMQSLSAEDQVYYDRVLVKRMTPNLVFAKYAQKRKIPKNSGETVSFRKYNSLPPATTPITEGVTPAGSKLSVTKLTKKLNQYGDFTTLTDRVKSTAYDPVLTEAGEILGEQAGLTLDTVTRDSVLTGTNVMYAGGKATTDGLTAADKISVTLILTAAKHLKNHNTRKFKEGYIAVIDPDTSFDLQEDPRWIDVSKYGNGGKNILDGEVGKIGGVRFIETTNVYAEKNASNVMVHRTLIFGKDAYGDVDVEGSKTKEGISYIYKGLGSGDDPLNQRATAGWKALHVATILNQMGIVRLEHACSE